MIILQILISLCVYICMYVFFKDFIYNMLHYRVILHVLVFLYYTTLLDDKNSYLSWIGIIV